MIRVCKVEDLPEVVLLLKKMHSEAGVNLPPVSPLKVQAALAQSMMRGMVFLYEHKGKIMGILAIEPATYWFSEGNFLADRVFYVESGHRNALYSKGLLQAARDYANVVKLPLTMAVTYGGEDAKRKDQFFVRNGFFYIGGMFRYEPKEE